MYGLALSLWMIDIHNVVTEIQTTLLAPVASTGSLANAYSDAVSQILRLSSVEDVLYAYMVGRLYACNNLFSAASMTYGADQHWRRHHYLACLCVLVKRKRAIHPLHPSRISCGLYMCVCSAQSKAAIILKDVPSHLLHAHLLCGSVRGRYHLGYISASSFLSQHTDCFILDDTCDYYRYDSASCLQNMVCCVYTSHVRIRAQRRDIVSGNTGVCMQMPLGSLRRGRGPKGSW